MEIKEDKKSLGIAEKEYIKYLSSYVLFLLLDFKTNKGLGVLSISFFVLSDLYHFCVKPELNT